MQNTPLLTVIVPAYNHENYVIECLDSIYNQTYKNFQWIVVDDCSTDTTTEILTKNQAKYNYELILHEKNIGLANTLNEVLTQFCKGKYISICASDDCFMPNKLEKQLSFLIDNPQYRMCYSRCIVVDAKSQEIRRTSRNIYKSGDLFKEILCRDFELGNATMIERDALIEVGCYKSGIIAEDYYINCLLSEKYKIGFLDEYLIKYRELPLQTKRDPMALIQSHKEILDTYAHYSFYPKALKKWEINSMYALCVNTPKYKKVIIKLFLKNLYMFFSLKYGMKFLKTFYNILSVEINER